MKYSEAFKVKTEQLTDDTEPIILSSHYSEATLFKRLKFRLFLTSRWIRKILKI